MAYMLIFLLKNVSSFCICKSYSHFFSKNTCEFDIVLTRIVNILTTNELIKLTVLSTTGSSIFWVKKKCLTWNYAFVWSCVTMNFDLCFAATPQTDYYIIAGVVYQAPDLCTVINSRLVCSLVYISDIAWELEHSWRCGDIRLLLSQRFSKKTWGYCDTLVCLSVISHHCS